ncbi:MAG: VWA domain-containing protein [Neptuniibacter sp.]
MFEFAWPWVWILLPLPVLVRILAPATALGTSNALKVPFIGQMERAVGKHAGTSKSSAQGKLIFALLIWTLFVASAAKPQWLGDPIAQQLEGRDLVLAVDLSESMLEKDFRFQGQLINRLVATKIVTGDFIERREGDRIGLILFAGQAYYQAPLTHDRKTVKTFLDEAQAGLAGKSTAIGDAIGLAIKRFKELESKQRILILLTDGTNNAGVLDPMSAAQLAKDFGVKVYTIGVAGGGQLAGPIGGEQALLNDYLNATPQSSIDEKTLQAIAQTTGGQYFSAGDLQQLAGIYAALDELEPVEQDSEFYRPIEPLFQWPLLLGLLMSMVLLVLNRRVIGMGS